MRLFLWIWTVTNVQCCPFCIAFCGVQIWRHISGGAASSSRSAASDHPGCCSAAGATAQCHWGKGSKLIYVTPYCCTSTVNKKELLASGQTLQRNREGHEDVPQVHGDSKQCEGAFHGAFLNISVLILRTYCSSSSLCHISTGVVQQ